MLLLKQINDNIMMLSFLTTQIYLWYNYHIKFAFKIMYAFENISRIFYIFDGENAIALCINATYAI